MTSATSRGELESS